MLCFGSPGFPRFRPWAWTWHCSSSHGEVTSHMPQLEGPTTKKNIQLCTGGLWGEKGKIKSIKKKKKKKNCLCLHTEDVTGQMKYHPCHSTSVNPIVWQYLQPNIGEINSALAPQNQNLRNCMLCDTGCSLMKLKFQCPRSKCFPGKERNYSQNKRLIHERDVF